ncbi:unnamed protein product [Miscanthus lutarioriparius]|uniref:Uncharacterized protein n=1 Tax=Miscanthus lutarioriparius TaxID=422564 RepID=A0A811RTL0_9POAL|nr:unnamed protein product [Miscanthus lutarioriparius]
MAAASLHRRWRTASRSARRGEVVLARTGSATGAAGQHEATRVRTRSHDTGPQTTTDSTATVATRWCGLPEQGSGRQGPHAGKGRDSGDHGQGCAGGRAWRGSGHGRPSEEGAQRRVETTAGGNGKCSGGSHARPQQSAREEGKGMTESLGVAAGQEEWQPGGEKGTAAAPPPLTLSLRRRGRKHERD